MAVRRRSTHSVSHSKSSARGARQETKRGRKRSRPMLLMTTPRDCSRNVMTAVMISRQENADAMRRDGRIILSASDRIEDRIMVLKMTSIREEILHFVEHPAVPRLFAAER